MQIKTVQQTGITTIHVEPGETVVIEFCPDGLSANVGSSKISLLIGTMFTPGIDPKMALSIALPPEKTYRDPSNHRSMALCDFAGVDKATIYQGVGEFIDLEKVA